MQTFAEMQNVLQPQEMFALGRDVADAASNADVHVNTGNPEKNANFVFFNKSFLNHRCLYNNKRQLIIVLHRNNAQD
jgi:hypothetical protein